MFGADKEYGGGVWMGGNKRNTEDEKEEEVY